MARRRTEAEKIAELGQLADKPKDDGTLNLRMTNGIYDSGWIVVPARLARLVHMEIK